MSRACFLLSRARGVVRGELAEKRNYKAGALWIGRISEQHWLPVYPTANTAFILCDTFVFLLLENWPQHCWQCGQRRPPFRCSWDLSLCYHKDFRMSQNEAKLGYTEHVHQEKSTLRCLSSRFVCKFGGLKSERCQFNILSNKKEITH